MACTLDSGALIAADRNDRRFWRFSGESDELFRVPAVVLTEVWRGAPNANLARALHGCDVKVIDSELAKAAGLLCARTGTDDPVDALVVACAAHWGDDILTADPDDLRPLAAAARIVGRILDLNDLV